MRELTPAEKLQGIAYRLRCIADTWPMHTRLLDKPFDPQLMFETVGKYLSSQLESDIETLDDIVAMLSERGGSA